ncbi:hypothetical protein Bca4012_029932 [Brassica carinata]
MLGDVDAFLEFPWGRDSFLHTVRCMKPPKFEKGKLVEDRVGMLVQKLKQSSFCLTGFPLALQLLAFRAIPMLQSKIPAPPNELTIMELTEPNLPSHPSIELDSVLQVEVNPSLLVTPIIPTVRGPQPGWGVWPNVEADEKVGYMEQLIANNHLFTKSMWPGGDCSEPVFIVTPPPQQPPHKKHTVPRKRKESKLKPRKCSKKRASTTSQRRITRLFAASVISLEAKIPVLEDQVSSLEATVATLGATNERLKTCVNHLLNRKRKRSTTGVSLSQRLVKHRRKSTSQTPQNIQEKKTDDCLVGSQSPILSQYQLHQHEDSLRSPHHPSPTHQQTDHQSQDHQPPADHDTHNHKSLTCLASTTDDHQTPNTQTPPHCGLPHPSPNHHSSDHHSHDHRSPDHHSPNHHYSDHHSHDHRSPDHHSPDHRSPDQHSHDHQSPDDHSKIPTTLSSHQTPHQQSPLHPSSADHPNVNHQTAIPSESTLLSSDRHSTDHHSPAPQTPEHKTPHHITPNHQTLEHKSSDSNSPTHSPPIHVSTPSSPPTHKPPADAFNLIQGSPSQHYAQIAILPQFDATPLEKPTSLEVMSGSDPATISAPFKPAGTTTPNSTPTKPAVSPQAFSPHSSSPNAFAALKGSTNTFLSTPNHQTGKVTVFSHPQPTTFYIGLLTHFYNGCRMAKNRKWIKKIPTPAPRTLKYERLLQKLMYCLHSLP